MGIEEDAIPLGDMHSINTVKIGDSCAKKYY